MLQNMNDFLCNAWCCSFPQFVNSGIHKQNLKPLFCVMIYIAVDQYEVLHYRTYMVCIKWKTLNWVKCNNMVKWPLTFDMSHKVRLYGLRPASTESRSETVYNVYSIQLEWDNLLQFLCIGCVRVSLCYGKVISLTKLCAFFPLFQSSVVTCGNLWHIFSHICCYKSKFTDRIYWAIWL
jgi:hypothetical protein